MRLPDGALRATLGTVLTLSGLKLLKAPGGDWILIGGLAALGVAPRRATACAPGSRPAPRIGRLAGRRDARTIAGLCSGFSPPRLSWAC